LQEHRALDIIGLPVIETTTGKKIAAVEDFLLDEDWGLHGILLDSLHWFSPSRCLKWEQISCGQDAVTIASEKDIIEFECDPAIHTLLTGKSKIIGLPVITKNGNQLGILEDVYFQQDMGKKVTGLEISDGLISDLREGRKKLPASEEATMGKDTIIVPMHSEDHLKV
jgi:uncharacterized protein YrrD